MADLTPRAKRFIIRSLPIATPNGAAYVVGHNSEGPAVRFQFGAGGSGLSAYQVAVNNGFEGTEEEWLESLVGATGPQGPIGNTGQTGAAGQNGTNGNRGSLFLGSYANQAALPAANGTTVRVGDFAYVEDIGELWQLT